MKKTIIILLALCLLLTACGQRQVHPSETEKTSGPAEIPSHDTESIYNPSAQETEPEKPAKELHPEMHAQSCGLGDYIETESVLYYNDRFRNRIYFSVDHGSHFYPLCSKANCGHSDENCNAYGNGVGYFEGFLYTVRFDSEADLFRVVRISLDGTDQEVVRTIPFPGGGAFKYYYHNNKFFLLYWPSADLPLEKRIDRVFVVNLKTGEMTEPLQDLLQDGMTISYFRFFQNAATVTTSGSYTNSGPEQTRVLYIDLNTWEVREYMKQVETYPAYMDVSKLYFLVNRNKFFDNSPDHDEGFYEQNLQTGEIVQRLKTDDIVRAIYDEDYIYALSYPRDKDGQYHTLYIYTRDYELVEQKELDKYEFLNYVSSERLFFSRNYDQGKLYRYMEKSDIGSGDMPIYDVNK